MVFERVLPLSRVLTTGLHSLFAGITPPPSNIFLKHKKDTRMNKLQARMAAPFLSRIQAYVMNSVYTYATTVGSASSLALFERKPLTHNCILMTSIIIGDKFEQMRVQLEP